MFGTIGHVRLKPGREADLAKFTQEWRQTIRPQVPGHVLELMGSVAGDPNHQVFVALVQDEATYRALAENPAQDAWYRRKLDLADGDITWEDVSMDIVIND